ncbi:MAG: pseudouridine synthase [Candidatus Woesearchaeota archaeon]
MEHRLQKIIASAGICSRRTAEELVKQGKVKVNGKVVTIGSKADIFTDTIIVDGKKLSPPEKLYLAFNKPPDCLTTLHDPKGRKTILGYIKLKERVIPVGRLDFKTQGLIFLTNDGDFANKVMHPRYEVEKTYMVFLNKQFDQKDVAKIKEGMHLEDYKTSPAKFRYGSPAKDVIEITIHEGQNRVVRNMMAALGYTVKRLIRVKIGTVDLGDIAQGKHRKMSYQEVQQFMKQTAQPHIKEEAPIIKKGI